MREGGAATPGCGRGEREESGEAVKGTESQAIRSPDPSLHPRAVLGTRRGPRVRLRPPESAASPSSSTAASSSAASSSGRGRDKKPLGAQGRRGGGGVGMGQRPGFESQRGRGPLWISAAGGQRELSPLAGRRLHWETLRKPGRTGVRVGSGQGGGPTRLSARPLPRDRVRSPPPPPHRGQRTPHSPSGCSLRTGVQRKWTES